MMRTPLHWGGCIIPHHNLLSKGVSAAKWHMNGHMCRNFLLKTQKEWRLPLKSLIFNRKMGI